MSATAKRPLAGRIIYLFFITLVVASMLSGLSWLQEFGCCLGMSVQLLSGRYSRGNRFMTGVGWCMALAALIFGIWQFEAARQHGHLWRRFPLPWGFVAFLLAAWIGVVITELRGKPPSL